MRWILFMTACQNTPDTARPTEAIDTDSDTDTETDAETGCLYEDSGYGESGAVPLTVTVVADGLATPWGLGWLPDGDMLLTERDGRLSRIDAERGDVFPITNVPITASGEGGLLGLAMHPDFASNRQFYLYYTMDDPEGSGQINRVERWTLSADYSAASPDKVIVDRIPARLYHNGGRIRFGPDGHLYVGTGDANAPASSQDQESLAGKILRVDVDGNVPDDNPFGTLIWMWGIRNTQGFDWFPDGTMAVMDHGPSGLSNEGGRSGHDEVTVASAGDNLGWPDIYACETAEGMLTPAATWAEAMPPGGAAFYTGSEISEWSGDLLVGVMGFGDEVPHLHRLRFDASGQVSITEMYLSQEYGRLREVIMGPDGGLYVTTSNCDGRGDCGDGDQVLRLSR